MSDETSFMIPGRPRPLPLERPLPGDQPPVPPQDRVGRHDGRHLPQDPATEALALRREPSALVVGQPNAPPRQLLLENAVLLHQILDDLLLVAVDPSSEGHEQQPQGGEVGRHRPILQRLILAHVQGRARPSIRTLRGPKAEELIAGNAGVPELPASVLAAMRATRGCFRVLTRLGPGDKVSALSGNIE